MTAASAIQPLARAHLTEARGLLAASCAFDAAAEVAEEKLFGPGVHQPAHALAVWRQGRLAGVAATSGPWLRLLAVHPDHRGQGLGSALLHAAEQGIARSLALSNAAPGPGPGTGAGPGTSAGPVRGPIRALDQPGNYLAPGVDLRNTETIAWLERRGYEQRGQRINLLVRVRGNPRIDEARALGEVSPDYRIRRASHADGPALRAMIENDFGAGWAFEADRAMEGDPPGVHLAVHRDSGEIAAFAAHDGNNRGLGWFGPTGTRSAHRGRGLGAALLRACLRDVAAAGKEVCEIAWIGPRAFYERTVGIAGERRFAVMQRQLSDAEPGPDVINQEIEAS